GEHALELWPLALGDELHGAIGAVPHPAAKSQGLRPVDDEIPKSDALDVATNHRVKAFHDSRLEFYRGLEHRCDRRRAGGRLHARHELSLARGAPAAAGLPDRKSTRLNSSHDQISYAVFCLKKKKK